MRLEPQSIGVNGYGNECLLVRGTHTGSTVSALLYAGQYRDTESGLY